MSPAQRRRCSGAFAGSAHDRMLLPHLERVRDDRVLVEPVGTVGLGAELEHPVRRAEVDCLEVDDELAGLGRVLNLRPAEDLVLRAVDGADALAIEHGDRAVGVGAVCIVGRAPVGRDGSCIASAHSISPNAQSAVSHRLLFSNVSWTMMSSYIWYHRP